MIAALVAPPTASLVMVIDRVKAPHILATKMARGMIHANIIAWDPKAISQHWTNIVVFFNLMFSVTLANDLAILLPTVIC